MKIAYLLLLSLLLIYFFYVNKKTVEGFTTIPTYDECRASGYSKEFCVQTPTLYFGPAACMCPDGSQGVIHPGLRGECLCSRYY